TLAASLFECFFILPSHIADWGKVGRSRSRDRLMRYLLKPYTRLLKFTLRRRYWVMAGIFVCLFLSFLPLHFGLVEVDMFQGAEFPLFYVHVTMPVGTRMETTDAVIRKFEELLLAMPKSKVKEVITKTGVQDLQSSFSQRNSHLGMIHVEVPEAQNREETLSEIIAEVRQKVSRITGPERIDFETREEGPPAGTDVEVIIKGKYFHELAAIAEELKARLAQTPGVIDIKDNYALGKEEIKLHIDEDKANEYGLTLQQIAFTARNAFEGTKATVFHDGDEEIDVVVKFSESARTRLKDVEDLKLMGAMGVPVPLRDVAQLKVEQGHSIIHRFKQERAITITANVDENIASGVTVNQGLRAYFDKISPRYPGYTLEFGGEFAEFQQAFRDIPVFFAFGIMLVYFILGTQFRSFLQPLIILMTVPFAFIGAMVGLISSGNPLSIPSTYGLVALAGIVVNDSIVLVEFINRQRTAGAGKWQAIINAGRTRLRPIILTSITTVSGLLPMALGIGGKSAIWMSMASTIVWGLSVATLLTLLVIPAFYAITEDIRQWRGVRVETTDIEKRVIT
ncbi:efflux RND transporter permease subunit, partial [Candidatus Poribacteria bacterium]|nr:efflux RND transporter permease subunit [Candidatus Poribacteria bacterium]